tara:strand:- start:10514 stop:10678 length:165 start_codon:yes stop_codon:yes gene_type:complete
MAFIKEYGVQLLGFFAYQALEFWFGRTDKTPAGSFGEFVLWKLKLIKPKENEIQ